MIRAPRRSAATALPKGVPVHWYTDVIRRYADFDGRSGRPEFWWFALWNVAITLVIYIVGIAILGSTTGGLLADLYGLLLLLPSLGVEIRRLHDTNKTGWWILIAFIPIVGAIVLIVFFASAGTPGPNKYGPEPTATAEPAY
jgi:uncharacterized membrane protein YhaH (DUF805 family)